MSNSDSSDAIVQSGPERLATILNFEAAEISVWNDRDLAAMLSHQFSAPLEFDLSSVVSRKATKSKTLDEALTRGSAKRIKSFEDMLFHPEPPVALLMHSKDFFKKRLRESTKDSPEWKISYLFYLLSVLAAGTRRAKVSALPKHDLLKASSWALAQGWVDKKTKGLIAKALDGL